MGRDKDEDLLRTVEVAALPIDRSGQETVPSQRRPSPRIALKRDSPSESPPATLRAPLTSAEWLGEETSLSRETEKTLSVPASVVPDRATLTVLNGLHAGQIFALDSFEHIIGRGTEADVSLEDPTISRRHARLARLPNGRFMVEDCGSTNGTFVAGRRFVGRAELQPGDRLQIGPLLMLRFAITDDAEEEMHRRLYESSTRDALTRAFNRKYLDERLLAELAYVRRHETPLALLMLDLDRFKEVNDAYGHLTGDLVLRVMSAHVSRLIRIEDVFARYGGEEFVILARSTAHKDACTLAERVRGAIEHLEISAPGRASTLTVTVSIGIASLSELPPGAGSNELIATADARLYRAKLDGRNRICGETALE